MLPAQEDVAGRLHEPLAVHHPLALVVVPAGPGEPGEHRFLGLLDLEEQRVGLVTAQHQDDPAAGAHAAHADHLAGHVGELVLLEQHPAVRLQRPPVLAEDVLQFLLDVDRPGQLAEQVPDRDDDRRVGHDPRPPVLHPGQLAEFLHAVPGAGLGQALVQVLALTLLQQAVPPGPEFVDVDLGVPDLEVAHPGQLPHDLPVARRRGEHDLAAVLVAEPVLARGHLQAGRQPLHVPLPGRGQALVEVVDVEDQLALGRAEEAEVGQVRVPAGLHDQPGGRGGGQVAGHGQGRAPVVRERGLHHPAVPHRDQVRHPRHALRLEQAHRVGPAGRRLPLGVALARHLRPRRLAADPALLRGHPLPRCLQPARRAAGQDHGPARPFGYAGGHRGGHATLGGRGARGRAPCGGPCGGSCGGARGRGRPTGGASACPAERAGGGTRGRGAGRGVRAAGVRAALLRLAAACWRPACRGRLARGRGLAGRAACSRPQSCSRRACSRPRLARGRGLARGRLARGRRPRGLAVRSLAGGRLAGGRLAGRCLAGRRPAGCCLAVRCAAARRLGAGGAGAAGLGGRCPVP